MSTIGSVWSSIKALYTWLYAELYQSPVRSSIKALCGALLKPYAELYQSPTRCSIKALRGALSKLYTELYIKL